MIQILLVESDQMVAGLFASLLRRFHERELAQSQIATDLDEATALVKAATPHILITEWNLGSKTSDVLIADAINAGVRPENILLIGDDAQHVARLAVQSGVRFAIKPDLVGNVERFINGCVKRLGGDQTPQC